MSIKQILEILREAGFEVEWTPLWYYSEILGGTPYRVKCTCDGETLLSEDTIRYNPLHLPQILRNTAECIVESGTAAGYSIGVVSAAMQALSRIRAAEHGWEFALD